jgi:hypothetical protein
MRRVVVALMLWVAWGGVTCAQNVDWKERVGKLDTARGAALEEVKRELVSGGMTAHKALKEGSPATAGLRSELRRAIRGKRDAAARNRGLLMHEWGAMSYSQGIDRGGFDSHREEAGDLPEFVQVWSELAKKSVRPLDIPGAIIVRKPIVYFYTDKKQTVSFSVACPHGMFTQWYPKAWRINPDPASAEPNTSPDSMTGSTGLLIWKNFDLVPGPAPALPPVPEAAWWWPICRDTDSTPIHADGVVEKFLFYRGQVADVPPVIKVEGGEHRKYTLINTRRSEPVQHLLLVNIEGTRAMAKYIVSVGAGQKIDVDLAMPTDTEAVADFAPRMRQNLAESLEEAGLFPREAAGMARIWQKDWFETQGVRVIYLNPPAATVSLMPQKIDPEPVESVRTYLVAVECLTDSIENVINDMIGKLGDGKYAVREAAQRQLVLLGKKAEPALRATLEKTDDEEVRNRVILILRRLEAAP